MKLNYETCLIGPKTILVPYRPEHVKKYHEWMQSPFLLEMTASEPLSLEEEIEMQQSWKNDDNKCTFIVLAKCAFTSSYYQSLIKDIEEIGGVLECNLLHDDKDKDVEFDFIQDTLDAMIGDVNLFLSEIEEDDETNQKEISESNSSRGIQAELDIMIAEEQYKKMGMGKEATIMMMLYGAQNLNIRKYVVKIKEDNVSSRRMFEKLGFKECNYAECFQEYELEFVLPSTDEMMKVLQKNHQIPVYKWHTPDRS